MTQLLQEAFSLVSSELTPHDQDVLVHVMIDHLKDLPVFLAEELEEQQFEASAQEALQADHIQSLLRQAFNKYQANHSLP